MVDDATNAPMVVELYYDCGTLVVPTLGAMSMSPSPHLVLDPRTGTYRAAAHYYREIVLALRDAGVDFEDRARRFDPVALQLTKPLTLYPHQRSALEAWSHGGSRGVVELPTGSGKTLLAVQAMVEVQRPTLIVVPTIDLMAQWSKVLEEWLGIEVGMLGGGSHERRSITVTTYDSAAAQTEFLGNQFGLLVCDECHHLPAPAYRFIAEGSIAPFRLGLTATLERADGLEDVTLALLGPLAHSVPIDALEGRYLAEYEVRSIPVSLTSDESRRYEEARGCYTAFLRRHGISFSTRDGWTKFIIRAARSAEGREAFRAYREQRRIALGSRAKLDALWMVLLRHRNERALVFTEDNDTVYKLSEKLFFPALTHQTKPSERKRLLESFASGDLPVLLTSKVLNEGVDVPEANVGVVLSGSGSVREHVQRLGRVLRPRPDKRAFLYEIYTDVAAEASISDRRRQHRAYRR